MAQQKMELVYRRCKVSDAGTTDAYSYQRRPSFEDINTNPAPSYRSRQDAPSGAGLEFRPDRRLAHACHPFSVRDAIDDVVSPPAPTLTREVCGMPHQHLRFPFPLQSNHTRRKRTRRDVRRPPGLMCVESGCDALMAGILLFETVVFCCGFV